ncbi:MAG TPA: methyltransferase domain-containing protein [Actinoallomurus sp.]|nr:methyltransferase domain-containing protein [Actinoallomurus sp.]
MLISARSYDEYVAMFDLSADDMRGSVLDCSAGAAAFVARVNADGGCAVAVDPIYDQGADRLADLARGGLGDCLRMTRSSSEAFVWDWYGSLERRERLRQDAAETFIADVRANRGGYVAGSLPSLPFGNASFDLVVCSHLMFTWDEVFGRDWHLDAARELTRVARHEARVFPTFGHTDRGPYPDLDWLRARLRDEGITSHVRTVPYEFQRGANTMLVLTPALRR